MLDKFKDQFDKIFLTESEKELARDDEIECREEARRYREEDRAEFDFERDCGAAL